MLEGFHLKYVENTLNTLGKFLTLMIELQHKLRDNCPPRTLLCGPQPPPKSCRLIGQVFLEPSLPKRSTISAVGE
jgi:hypothetical protein